MKVYRIGISINYISNEGFFSPKEVKKKVGNIDDLLIETIVAKDDDEAYEIWKSIYTIDKIKEYIKKKYPGRDHQFQLVQYNTTHVTLDEIMKSPRLQNTLSFLKQELGL